MTQSILKNVLLAAQNLKERFSKENMQSEMGEMEDRPNIFYWKSKGSLLGY